MQYAVYNKSMNDAYIGTIWVSCYITTL